MIEETACNEEAALIEGGLPGATGTGVTAADAPAETPVAGDSAAEALATEASAETPIENVSRETLAPEQGECKSRQRASLEVPVDMISIARTAQIEGAGLKLVAPAKVNLFLSIGDRRDNGYHDVSTVLHAVALHDVLYMKRADIVAARAALESAEEGAPTNTASAGPAGNILISISCDARGGVAPLNVPARENIVFKAIDLIARKADISYDDAINVRIEKNIPHEGGLGGGSSDAAAALVGAARLWGISEDDPLIEEAAHELGSDVAFFLHGGCACFTGTGELFDHELEAMKKPLVLIKPESGVSTAEAYRTFDGNPQNVDESAAAAAEAAQTACEVPLVNNLSIAAESVLPELADVRAWLHRQAGVEASLLCGSGSTTFAVCRDFNVACSIAAAAQSRGWWARTTMFGSLKAAVVPEQS